MAWRSLPNVIKAEYEEKRLYPAVDIAAFCLDIADPRPPNFAEIHARGRRGRLEYDHRDLIPPWGHRLLHSEEGKPTMPVCFDRNGGAFPSQRTGMVGKDNNERAGHGRHKANSIRISSTIHAAYDGQLQAQVYRTVWHSGLPGLRCVPVCSCSGRHSLRTRISSGALWGESRLQLDKAGRKRRRKGDNGGRYRA